MKVFFKRSFIIILLICFCVAVGKSWYWATGGFQVSRVLGWEENLSIWNEEAEKALDQTYYSFGRGRQCFAFMSADGKYVIKIPRYDRYCIPLWLQTLPFLSEKRERRNEDNLRRKAALMESFKLTFSALPEQTAVVGIQFGVKGKKVEVVDRLGRKHILELDRAGFVLQHRKELFHQVFQQALAKGDVGSMLDQLMEVIVERAKKGIVCKDGSFLRNFGFDEKRAFQIDVGSFYQMDNPKAFEKSVRGSWAPIREWIERVDPELLTLLDGKIEEALQ